MMRRLRRLAPLLVGLLFFQLSLLGAGAACAVPAVGGPAATGGTMASASRDGAVHAAHGNAGHGHHAGEAVESAKVPPTDGGPPTQHHDGRAHCPATMGCATIAAAGESIALSQRGVLAAARIAAPDATVPASVIGAPEPPPPRA